MCGVRAHVCMSHAVMSRQMVPLFLCDHRVNIECVPTCKSACEFYLYILSRILLDTIVASSEKVIYRGAAKHESFANVGVCIQKPAVEANLACRTLNLRTPRIKLTPCQKGHPTVCLVGYVHFSMVSGMYIIAAEHTP